MTVAFEAFLFMLVSFFWTQENITEMSGRPLSMIFLGSNATVLIKRIEQKINAYGQQKCDDSSETNSWNHQ